MLLLLKQTPLNSTQYFRKSLCIILFRIKQKARLLVFINTHIYMPDHGTKSLIFPLFLFFCNVYWTTRAIKPGYQNVILCMCTPKFINFRTPNDRGFSRSIWNIWDYFIKSKWVRERFWKINSVTYRAS